MFNHCGTSGIGYELAKLFAQGRLQPCYCQETLPSWKIQRRVSHNNYEVEVVKICKDLFDTRNALVVAEEIAR